MNLLLPSASSKYSKWTTYFANSAQEKLAKLNVANLKMSKCIIK